MTIFYIAFAGALGVLARHVTGHWTQKWPHGFPINNILVNGVGCFLAGLILAYSLSKGSSFDNIRTILIIGFCGGLTTFSGFGVQFIQLLQNEKYALALSYAVINPALCLAATALGFFALKAILA
jgi:fluoride exporter